MAEYLDFFNVYIMGVVEMSFQFYFLAKILKKKMWPPFYFLFAVGAVIINDFVPASTIIGFVVLIFLLTVYGTVICRAGFKHSLLYAALAAEIMLLCGGIVNSMISLPYPWLSAFFHETDNIAAMLVSEAASLVLTGFCYYMVYRYFSRDDLDPVDAPETTMGIQQMVLIFIPILMIFIMSNYINAIEYDFQFEISVDKGPAEHFFSHGQMLSMYFLGLASLFCILFSYKKLQQSFRLNTEISLLEQQEHSLNQYVEEAKTRYDETKSFRHDIKNHIAVVKKLLQNGKLEEAVTYMEDLDDMAEKMSFPCSTNNPVVDILVGNKLGIAKSMGIDVDCSLLLPYPCGIRDIDICIVLSNALDNAIHAVKNLGAGIEKYTLSDSSPPAPSGACITGCPNGYTLSDSSPPAPSGACITGCPNGYTLSDSSPSAPSGACITGCPNGYIRVSGRIQGDFLMMEIQNSFHGKSAFKKGTGLSNVKKVAEKYGGAMSIETQEHVFVLHVLLIIPQHPESSTQQMD